MLTRKTDGKNFGDVIHEFNSNAVASSKVRTGLCRKVGKVKNINDTHS